MVNAAKKIRRFLEQGEQPEQVRVLTELAASLELGRSFDLKQLYEIDMRYFDVALELLRDWRFDHHIAARSKLLEQLLVQLAPEARVELPPQVDGKKPRTGKKGKKDVQAEAEPEPTATEAEVAEEAAPAKPAARRSGRRAAPPKA